MVRLNHSFFYGVLLVINSVRDIYLVVDGPECIFDSVENVMAHDLFSTLLNPNGHRVFCTKRTAEEVIFYDGVNLKKKIPSLPAESILLYSMPFIKITDPDYTNLGLMQIENKEISDDLHKGFDETLNTLALNIETTPQIKKKNDVAIVGMFNHRNEGDSLGDVEEIKKILKHLGLNVVSIWPSKNLSHLKQISSASTIISLPYGRKASGTLAKKTGAKMLEVDFPLGIEGTNCFINQIIKGMKIKCIENNEEVQNCKKVVAKSLKWLENKSFLVVSDPAYAEGLGSILRNYSKRTDVLKLEGENTYDKIMNLSLNDYDLIIGNAYICNVANKSLEFGFPSEKTHFLTYRPILGYKGFVELINRIVNAL